MQRALSLDQGPPFSLPLRYFLTAPLFGIAAGILLFAQGPEIMASRWSPSTLAFTHLLTLGYLALTMLGALFQILPVVGGVVLFRPTFVGAVSHALLVCGTIALVVGFLGAGPGLFKLALGLLLPGFVLVLGVFGYGLWHGKGSGPMISTIRYALTGLAIAAALGGTAASAFAWSLSLPLIALTNLHAAWGLLGAVAMLTMGVAFQVIPMFQVTPSYPRIVTQWLVLAIFITLGIWSCVTIFFAEASWSAPYLSLAIGTAVLLFCGVTLSLLRRRKRPLPDPTTAYWITGLISLIACVLLFLTVDVIPDGPVSSTYPVLTGMLFIFGFAGSVINGMLYKIVPFLVWYHLQSMVLPDGRRAPNVKQVIPDRGAWRQFVAHLAALLAVVLAAVYPGRFSQASGLLLAVSSGWLCLNLANGARLYYRMVRELRTLATAETLHRPKGF